MTEADLKKAKIGDRVKFVPINDGGEYSEGVLTGKLARHFEVTWDDGAIFSYATSPASCVFLK